MVKKYVNRSIFFFLLLFSSLSLISCAEKDKERPPIENDNFVGEYTSLELGELLFEEYEDNLICRILAPDGTIISRYCKHEYKRGVSYLTFDTGLREGIYRLLYLEYGGSNVFGIGAEMELKGGRSTLLDPYDATIGLYGSGTQSAPYQVTSADHLSKIREFTNTNSTEGIYFVQSADILGTHMLAEGQKCDPVHYWTPIGYNNNNPFCGIYDGNNHYIEGVKSVGTEKSVGVGLFGFLRGATIINLTVKNSYVNGVYGVGTIAGIAISRGGIVDTTHIYDCTVSSSEIYGTANSVSAGGIIGAVDSNTILDMARSTSDKSIVKADYNAGGLVGAGALNSSVYINACTNDSNVSVNKGSAGGIIAAADTINITSSVNMSTALVSSPITDIDGTQRAVGGIMAGARYALITACENYGIVEGYEGVGGIIGSTRVTYSDESGYLFNNAYIRYCKNGGTVSGVNNVGGICGEAQLATYGCLNTGKVDGTDYVGGIAGYTSIAGIHNSLNSGEVKGGSYVAGIVGKTSMVALANCQNFAPVIGTGSNIAGIAGYAENNSIIHFSSNFGAIQGGSSTVGGIVAEMGKPDELSPLNKAEIAFGVIQIAAGFIAKPIFAVVHGTVEAAKTAILITEVVTDIVLTSVEGVFMMISCHHLNHGHMSEIAANIVALNQEAINNVKNEMRDIRESHKVSLLPELSSANLEKSYQLNVDSLERFLDNEVNVESFNTRMNEALYERGKEVEELNEERESDHLIASGIILALDLIALTATIATGGAAAPAVLGVVVSCAGGLNAITKGASDYQDNIIMVHQCLNSGTVSGSDPDYIGGIAGQLRSRGYISDCFNSGTGPGGGGQLVGDIGEDFTTKNSLGVADLSSWEDLLGNFSNVNKFETVEGLYYYQSSSKDYSHATSLSKEKLGKSDSYTQWNIGSESMWSIPEVSDTTKYSYPIPNRSLYQIPQ